MPKDEPNRQRAAWRSETSTWDSAPVIRALGLVAVLLAAGCVSTPEDPHVISSGRPTPPETTSPTTIPRGSAAPFRHPPGLVEHNGTLESPLSDVEVEAIASSWAKSLNDSLHGTTKPDGRYFLVRLYMRNTTDRPVTPPTHLSLFAASGAEFAPKWDQTFGQTVLVGHGKVNDLGPGAKTTVVLVYDVPTGTRPATVDQLKL